MMILDARIDPGEIAHVVNITNNELVIGHGIVAGNISHYMLRFTKLSTADVRFDLKSKPDL
jgi:hypothetical protein